MNARPSDVQALNELGRAKLHRAILTGILKAEKLEGLASPELVERALTQGRTLELVRHLTALKREGGRP